MGVLQKRKHFSPIPNHHQIRLVREHQPDRFLFAVLAMEMALLPAQNQKETNDDNDLNDDERREAFGQPISISPVTIDSHHNGKQKQCQRQRILFLDFHIYVCKMLFANGESSTFARKDRHNFEKQPEFGRFCWSFKEKMLYLRPYITN